MLLRGTADDDTPCPGYLFEEIASILRGAGAGARAGGFPGRGKGSRDRGSSPGMLQAVVGVGGLRGWLGAAVGLWALAETLWRS